VPGSARGFGGATGTVVWESKSLKVTTTIVDSELHVMLHRLVERATDVITVPVFGTTTPATACSVYSDTTGRRLLYTRKKKVTLDMEFAYVTDNWSGRLIDKT
jgi:hypothetical protein